MKAYILATPIGNPRDVSLRFLDVIKKIPLVFCEDTRKFKQLLKSLNIVRTDLKVKSLPVFKEKEMNWRYFFESEVADSDFAFLSDAGTPVINDPGSTLIQESIKRSYEIVAVPGPSAPTVALQIGGGFGLPYCFAGFCPKSKFESFFALSKNVKTFIFFATKHNYKKVLEYLAESSPEQNIYVCREMTKTHEDYASGKPKDVLDFLNKKKDALKGSLGELTFVLEGASEEPKPNFSLDDLVTIRNADQSTAAKQIAMLSGLSKRDCYKALEDSK